MDELKSYFAKKLSKLRNDAGMTQSELGDKLSYSDKTVSKWERGEAIPDASVLMRIGKLFGVSVDSLLDYKKNSETASAEDAQTASGSVNYNGIIRLTIVSLWTLAVVLFVSFWIAGNIQWMIFVYAVPVTLVVLLVLNSVWNQGKRNFWIISGLVQSVIAVVYLSLMPLNNPWQLFLVAIPAELLILCCFGVKNRKNSNSTNRRI